MRALTNVMLFLVGILAVIGLYVFRQQSFASLQQRFGGSARSHAAPRIPARPSAGATKPASARTKASNAAKDVQVIMTVIPVEPNPSTDTIQIGMQKKKLWRSFGEPDVMTSSREGNRFLGTFIYLEDISKATVVRLVNGTVVSVSATHTVDPPFLASPADRARIIACLTSDSMSMCFT